MNNILKHINIKASITISQKSYFINKMNTHHMIDKIRSLPFINKNRQYRGNTIQTGVY